MGDEMKRARIRWTVAAAPLWVGVVLAGAGCMTPVEPEQTAKTAAESAETRRNIGVDHVVNGRTAFGIRELRHALLLDDQDTLTHLWLGQAYLMKDHVDEALFHAERAVELDPESHEARLNLSVIYIQVGRLGEAIAHADLLIDDPTFASPWRAYTNRGWALVKQNRLGLARASLQEGLEYRPGYWPAILNLGILESIEGDQLGSLKYLQQVIDFEPGFGAEAEAHYRMAEAYVRLGQRERAGAPPGGGSRGGTP